MAINSPAPSAVMQQRRDEEQGSLDDFPTPAWATRQFCHWLQDQWVERDENGILVEVDLKERFAWDPCVGRGTMARPLHEFFAGVYGSDAYDYGVGYAKMPFQKFDTVPHDVSAVITNPPFNQALDFVNHGITHWLGEDRARVLAVLVRSGWLQGAGRHRALFDANPPDHVLQPAERPAMFKGRVDSFGSTTTAYVWCVWSKDPSRARNDERHTRLHFLPPGDKPTKNSPGLYKDGDDDGYDFNTAP